MLLTLREARRLEQEILEVITKINTSPVSTRDPHSKDSVEDWLYERITKFESNHWKAASLRAVRGDIRRRIQAENEHSGINEAIASRKSALDMIHLWEGIVGSYDVDSGGPDSEVVSSRVEQILNSSDSWSMRDKINVSLVTYEFFMEAKEQIKAYRSLVRSLDDKIYQLNAGTKISLNEELGHEEILKEFSLL